MGRQVASGPQLVAYVHVTDPKGNSVAFAPGDDVPAWAQRAITNPKAWEGGELPKVRASAGTSTPKGKGETDEPAGGSPDRDANDDGTGSPDPDADGANGDGSDADGGGEGTPEELPVPPKSGNGSGKGAWQAYARSKGVEISDEATRDEIIELLEDADVETEQPSE